MASSGKVAHRSGARRAQAETNFLLRAVGNFQQDGTCDVKKPHFSQRTREMGHPYFPNEILRTLQVSIR
jgi:hypothetical protein